MQTIHESLVNGQFAQAGDQIREHGSSRFFTRYPAWIIENVGGDAEDITEAMRKAGIAITRATTRRMNK